MEHPHPIRRSQPATFLAEMSRELLGDTKEPLHGSCCIRGLKLQLIVAASELRKYRWR